MRIFFENSRHTLRTYDGERYHCPSTGLKRVLSGYYVPEFQNYEGKQNNKRARDVMWIPTRQIACMACPFGITYLCTMLFLSYNADRGYAQ